MNIKCRINGENIPDSDLCEIATIVKEKCEELSLEISVFAQISAMAFLYFAEIALPETCKPSPVASSPPFE